MSDETFTKVFVSQRWDSYHSYRRCEEDEIRDLVDIGELSELLYEPHRIFVSSWNFQFWFEKPFPKNKFKNILRKVYKGTLYIDFRK